MEFYKSNLETINQASNDRSELEGVRLSILIIV